jgi:hypothetical protein
MLSTHRPHRLAGAPATSLAESDSAGNCFRISEIINLCFWPTDEAGL